MKKRLGNWLKTPIGIAMIVISVLLILFVLSDVIAFTYRENCYIDATELESHNQKLEMISDDYSSIYQMEDVSVDIGREDIRITLYGNDCNLEVVLDKEHNVISTKITDTRFFSRGINITGLISFSMLVAFGVVAVICVIIDEIKVYKYICSENKAKKHKE